MALPLVSITIPVYNGETFLEKSVQSALDQAYPNIEIVIIIDGSHDHSEDIIKELQKKYPQKIRYQWQENQGLPRTRNELIKMSRGEYIAILDQDDLWKPEKLEKQMALFAQDPSVGLVFSSFTYIDEQGNPTGDYQDKMYRGHIFNELLESYFIPCPSIVFKKSIIEKIGLFDPAYKYSEEADFALKAALFYKMDYAPEPLCYYRQHSRNTSKNEALVDHERYLLKKNILNFAQKMGIRLENERAIRRQVRKLLLVHLRGQVFKLFDRIFKGASI